MRVVTVGSGEGGAGRSSVAAHLGVALARRDLRVVLVDLDLRSGDLHLRLGVPREGSGVSSILRHGPKAAASAARPLGEVRGLSLVAGVEETVRAASLTEAEVGRLARGMRGFDADIAVVDLPSGIAPAVLDLFLAGDEQLVVADPSHRSARHVARFLHLARLRHASRGGARDGAQNRAPRVYTSLDDLVRDMNEMHDGGGRAETHYAPSLVLNRFTASPAVARERFLAALCAETGLAGDVRIVAEIPEDPAFGRPILAEDAPAHDLPKRVAQAVDDLARRIAGTEPAVESDADPCFVTTADLSR